MIPINGAIYGLLFAAGSRLVRGEVEVSENTAESLERARDHLEDFSELIGDLSPTRPGTWGHFAGRVVERSFSTRQRFDSARDALRAGGFDGRVEVAKGLALAALKPGGAPLFEDENGYLMVVEDRSTPTLCFEIDTSPRCDEIFVHFRRAESSRSEVLKGVGDLFWEGRRAVYLESASLKLAYREEDLSRFEYHGDRRALIEEWRAFGERGLRRHVLLQAPPGCGKSTLCGHAAKCLGQRVVFACPHLISATSVIKWYELLELLRPEVLIFDDIDRVGGSRGDDLEKKLAFFEGASYQVPWVFFTSNDHTRLPAAMRRPGRIDEVIDFAEPNKHVQRKIVEKLAAREGLEVPNKELPRLLELLENYSSAHVVEALRRAHVLGWEASYQQDKSFQLQREYNCQQDWLRIHGFREYRQENPWLFAEIAARVSMDVAYEDERCRILRAELPGGAQFCMEDAPQWDRSVIYYRDSIDGLQAFREGIGKSFWEGRPAVVMDSTDNRPEVRALSLENQQYHGPLLERVDQWRAFMDQGIRRNILLQGPPGCGKSTFCKHVAREVSQRTLMLTSQAYEELNFMRWRELLNFLAPEVVIVDDVDRVQEYRLESSLKNFEEGYCEVPLVFFTTNDHQRLPEAMRRPGRIDQILEFEPPSQELRWRLIREMAAREGVDELPEDQLQRLDALVLHQSTAHLVEALRRARVLGWAQVFNTTGGDTTFAAAEAALADGEAAEAG